MQQKKNLLLFGYTRNIGIELPPNDIMQLIIIWIHLVDEWDKSMTHENVRVTSHSVKSLNSPIGILFNHSFGSIVVGNGEHESWTIKITKYGRGTMIIGIIDQQYINSDLHDFTNNECFGYGLAIVSRRLFHRDIGKTNDYLGFGNINIDFTEGTIIKIELDMTNNKNGVMRYYVDDDIHYKSNEIDNKFIVYDNIDIDRKYRFCVALGDENDILTLI